MSEWVCLRRGYGGEPPGGMVRGKWYRLSHRELIHGIPTAFVDVDGHDGRVNAADLLCRESQPEYAQAYSTEMPTLNPGDEAQMMRWIAVCPEGHEGDQEQNPPETFDCPSCRRVYAVQTEDSALRLNWP